ncbi:hypothetical protein DPMN_010549 [Dreissena polymorpha]|uniref:Uncharacterized protein n=1 Tax=Dreissena polymorpha TaxID=45954 RepID=A0A9D4N291_DREPO|nr:hypothetical protein DPMN_010549 [Dreissena polymorpha]
MCICATIVHHSQAFYSGMTFPKLPERLRTLPKLAINLTSFIAQEAGSHFKAHTAVAAVVIGATRAEVPVEEETCHTFPHFKCLLTTRTQKTSKRGGSSDKTGIKIKA